VAKATASHAIPYPEKTDDANVPSDMQAMAEKVDSELDAIDLSQLAVPGSSDGKLVIVKDGAAAYKAMSGDGTIDEDGNFQLGSKVVGTGELGDKAVTTAKVDDGAVTSQKAKLTAGVIAGSTTLSLSGVYQDVPGAMLEITPAVASKLLVTATFQFTAGAGSNVEGTLSFDGSDQSRAALLQEIGSSSIAASVSQSYELALTAGEKHTIKMRAVRGGGGIGSSVPAGCSMRYELIAS
jgi:hypothetical protein